MNESVVWYFKVEGAGENQYGINNKFGFFVHCLVAAETIEKGLNSVKKELLEDGLNIIDISYKDKFNCLLWEDSELENRLKLLSKKAQNEPNKVFFSTFDSWEME